MTEALENQSQDNLEASLAQVHWVLVTALGLLPDIYIKHKQKSPLDQGAIQNQIRNLSKALLQIQAAPSLKSVRLTDAQPFPATRS